MIRVLIGDGFLCSMHLCERGEELDILDRVRLEFDGIAEIISILPGNVVPWLRWHSGNLFYQGEGLDDATED